jgi:hypothetical protein
MNREGAAVEKDSRNRPFGERMSQTSIVAAAYAWLMPLLWLANGKPCGPGMPFDYGMVNLTYTSPSGSEMSVGYASDPAACNGAALAWRYDDAKAPTKFLLCDTACTTVASGGKIAIALHCPTIPLN